MWQTEIGNFIPFFALLLLCHFVSQEPCMISFWFLVHIYKMMISPANFFIFSKFWFWVFRGLKTKKNRNLKKMKKIAGDIIILHMCTKNQNNIMHGSWDTNDTATIFCHFGPFFALLCLQFAKSKLWKKMKKQLEILSVYTSVP